MMFFQKIEIFFKRLSTHFVAPYFMLSPPNKIYMLLFNLNKKKFKNIFINLSHVFISKFLLF
jgi:hypothetical protein